MEHIKVKLFTFPEGVKSATGVPMMVPVFDATGKVEIGTAHCYEHDGALYADILTGEGKMASKFTATVKYEFTQENEK